MGRLTIQEDFDRGLGWVTISVAEGGAGPRAASVSIQRRSSDKPHLGPQGWQTQQHWLMPDTAEEVKGATVLRYGPTVTAHVAFAQDLTITVAPIGLSERHFWPDVPAPPPDARGLFVTPCAEPPDIGPEEDEPPHQPKGGSKSSSDEPGTGTNGDKSTNLGAKGPQAPIEAPPQSHPGSRPFSLRAGRRTLFAGGIVVLGLLALAALVLTKERAPVVQSERDLPAPPAAETSLLARYDVYRLAGGEADALLALGREALRAGDADLATRAISLSASRGSAAANLAMGKRYDPAESRGLSGQAEPDSAARYYNQAAAAGNAEAAALLARLCERATAPPEAETEAFANFQLETYCR
jgi:hypothetical protein